jgi:hypothetical protein
VSADLAVQNHRKANFAKNYLRTRPMKSSIVKRSVIHRRKTTNGMLRTTAATVICALALATSFPTTASAWYPPPPPPPPPPPITTGTSTGAGAGAGAGATAGFIGFVAVLVAYDLLRRTTCIGDPWLLGGPGFTTPITPASGNVMIPQCPIVKKQPAVRTRG